MKLPGQALRNLYRVYEEGDSYIVAGENPKGQRYECKVPREAVSYLRDRMAGQRVTAQQAGVTSDPQPNVSSSLTPTVTS